MLEVERPETGADGLRRAIAIVVAAIFAWSLSGDAAAGPQPVAMVTDIEGRATIAEAGGAVALLAELAPGARVDVGSGARIVVVYYASGEEFAFRGPGSLRIGAEAAERLSGAALETRHTLLAGAVGDIVIAPAGVIQASLVMRVEDRGAEPRLIGPVDTRTLAPRPLFRWQAIAGVETYRFELIDGAGRTLTVAEVAATELRLPESIVLAAGETYTWEVSARAADGAVYSNWGDFSLSPPTERALVERLRPPGDATFSERVLFAAVLEQLGLSDEARGYWRALLAERPGNARLRRLAGG